MRLFISYAREDITKVRKLADEFRELGHDPWLDEQQLIPGTEWQPRLRDAIAKADAFVYALTPASVASEWCQWEFIAAIKLDKPLFPILLEETELPLALRQYHYLDIRTGFNQRNVGKLLRFLEEGPIAIPKAEVPPEPADPKGAPARAATPQSTADAPDAFKEQPETTTLQENAGTKRVRTRPPWEVILPCMATITAAIIAALVALFTLFPESDRNHYLYQVGLISASDTPVPSLTPTLSPTPTPSATPTASFTPTPSVTPTASFTPTPEPSAIQVAVANLSNCPDITPEDIQSILPDNVESDRLYLTFGDSENARRVSSLYELVIWGTCGTNGRLILNIEILSPPSKKTGIFMVEPLTLTTNAITPNQTGSKRLEDLLNTIVAYVTGGNYVQIAARFSSLRTTLGTDAIFLQANSLLFAFCHGKAIDIYNTLPQDDYAVVNNEAIAYGFRAFQFFGNDFEPPTCPRPSSELSESDNPDEIIAMIMSKFDRARDLTEDIVNQAYIAANQGTVLGLVGNMGDSDQVEMAESYCRIAIDQQETTKRGNLCLAQVRLGQYDFMPSQTVSQSCAVIQMVREARDTFLDAAESVPQRSFLYAFFADAELHLENPECALSDEQAQLTTQVVNNACKFLDDVNRQPAMLYPQRAMVLRTNYVLLPDIKQTCDNN